MTLFQTQPGSPGLLHHSLLLLRFLEGQAHSICFHSPLWQVVDPLYVGNLGYTERNMWEMFSEYVSLKISFNYTILNNSIARQSRLTVVQMTSSARVKARISLVDTHLVSTTVFFF